jgi:hypothetical protein
VIDECFFVERVSENLEEIGNLQRMLCENFAVSWIERAPHMVSLGSGCNHDIGPRPIATRLWEYRVGEKMGQLVQFLHLQLSTQLPITTPTRQATHSGLVGFFLRSLLSMSDQDSLQFPVALRHDRSVQRRIRDARFHIVKTMAGWDWNWPAKINRMQVDRRPSLKYSRIGEARVSEI